MVEVALSASARDTLGEELREWFRQEEKKQQGLLDEIRSLTEDRRLTSTHDADSDTSSESVIRSRLETCRMRIRQLKEALHLWEIGKYGICAECEEPIPLDRLRAVPWTDLCVECAEANGH